MLLLYESYYKELGQNIAFYRKRQGLTQEMLAEAAEITNVHLSRIETGAAAASLDTVFGIAKILGVEPYKLFQPKD